VQFLYAIMSNPLTLPINYYPQVLENAASLQILQIQVNVINILFVIFRFFKLYKFQDQLRELSDTFAAAWTDLYHFMIMWLLVFAGFSIIGHIMFGQHMFDYSSVLRSFVTQFEMMMNNYDYPAMARISPFFAPIYIIMFVFIASICLINILVAILMDAYDVATERPFSRSMVEQLAIIANRAGMHFSKKLQPLKNKIMSAAEENLSDNEDNIPPRKPISTADMMTVLAAKKAAMAAEGGDVSKEEQEGFATDIEDLTKFASTVLPGGGPSGFDLARKMCACNALALVCDTSCDAHTGPSCGRRKRSRSARRLTRSCSKWRCVPPARAISPVFILFILRFLTRRSHQVDLVKRENERLNRQIDILANRFSSKVTSDVLVREGWLDKRSERLHESNVRRASTFSFQSADVTCTDFEKGCIGLEDVAAAVGGGIFCTKNQSHSHYF
jgi:hypothetical protein